MPLRNLVSINPRSFSYDFPQTNKLAFIPMHLVDELNYNLKSIDLIESSNVKGYTPFQEGDLLFAKITPCMENGKISLALDLPTSIGYGSTEFFVFRKKTDNLLIEFLKSIFIMNGFRKMAKANFSGAAGQQRVPTDFFNRLRIPLPSLEIQENVISTLNNALALKISREQEANQLLASIDDYLLGELGINLPEEEANTIENRSFKITSKKAVGGRLDPFYNKEKYFVTNESVKNGLYDSVLLKDLIEGFLVKGYLPNAEEKDGDFSVIQINSIKRNGTINLDSLITAKNVFSKAQKLTANDILIVITGATIGKVGYWIHKGDYYLGGDIVKFQTDPEVFNPYFVYSYLRSTPSQLELIRNITGATNGHLAPSDIKHIVIPKPPIEVQNAIATEIRNRTDRAFNLYQEAKDDFEAAKQQIENLILNQN